MRVERCIGEDMRQAMVKVRECLGEDALIISNRRINGKTEIIAAIDDAPAGASRQKRAELPVLEDTVSTQQQSPRTRRKRVQKTADNPSLSEIRKELSRLRNMFEGELSQLSWREMSERQPNKVAIQKRLETCGLNAFVSNMIADKVMPCNDLDEAWKNALKKTTRLIEIPQHPVMEDGGILALLGSTGVGKTTTAAKIAAKFAARWGENEVALVSTDNKRTGGKEQLLSFGSNMGIAVQFAPDKESLERTLTSLSQKRLVIIDTAGISQRDLALSERLQEFRLSNRKVHSCLVLSATTQEAIINETIRAFAGASLQSAIVTRTDECGSLGPVLSNLIRHQLPLAMIGTGAQVPEDLEKPTPKLLLTNLVQSYRKAMKEDKLNENTNAPRRVVNG